jgi:hypothetical protein
MSEINVSDAAVKPGPATTGVVLLDETIELHNIEHIPDPERHGSPRSQFTLSDQRRPVIRRVLAAAGSRWSVPDGPF